MCNNEYIERVMNDHGIPITELLGYFNDKEFEAFKNEKLGVLTDNYKKKYKEYYDRCDTLCGITEYEGRTQQKTTELKGRCFEELVKILFEGTGGYFKTKSNVGTFSNEIDIVAKLNEKGKGIERQIDSKFHKMICECKNHKSTIKVDYIGKFYSMLDYCYCDFGIFFSWKGLSGKNSWNSSTGLVKKLFLKRSAERKPIYIIDFNKEDFWKIYKGESLFKILEDKVEQLEFDIRFEKIQAHDNAEKIKSILEDDRWVN